MPMPNRRHLARKLAEPVLLAALALACSRFARIGAAAAAAAHVPFQPTAAGSLLFVYALAFATLLLVSIGLIRKGSSLSGFVLGEFRAEMSGHVVARDITSIGRWHWFALFVITFVGLAVRVAFLTQPMRYDESVSFLYFVNGPFSQAFYYPLPNNHVLNTLLERLSCAVLGPIPLGIRLPAFAAGVALIPCLHNVCRKIDSMSGLFAAAGIAAMPLLVLYSANGRGYTLVCLLTVLLIRRSMGADGRSVDGRWGVAALLSALGIWVMPSMLFVVASVLLWVTASLMLDSTRGARAALSYAIAYVGATMLLTLLFYTPVVLVSNGFESLLSNRFVRPLPVDQFFAAVIPHWIETFHDFSRDIPLAVASLVLVAAFGGVFVAARRGQLALALLLPAFVLGTALMFLAKRSIPYTRTWVFLIPVVLICADVFFCRVLAFAGRGMRVAFALAMCLGVGAIAGRLFVTDAITRYPDTGTFAQARDVAAQMAPILTAGDVVCAPLPADGPLAYYLWRIVPAEVYVSRPLTERTLSIERDSVSFNTADARVLASAPGYRIYEWNGVREVPGSSCWSPALLSRS